MQIWMKQLAKVAISAVILSGTYACAGLPQGAGEGRGVQQQGAAGGAAQIDMGQKISQVAGQALGGGAAEGGGGLLGMGAGWANAGGPGQAGGGVGQAGAARQGDVGVSTLVIGNMALVGVDLNTLGAEAAGGAGGGAGGAGGGMPPGPAGAPVGVAGAGGVMAGGPMDVEGTVKNQVRAAFPQVADVFVTTDPELVHQIAMIAGDIQQGISVSGRLEEVFSIARRMAPAGGAGM